MLTFKLDSEGKSLKISGESASVNFSIKRHKIHSNIVEIFIDGGQESDRLIKIEYDNANVISRIISGPASDKAIVQIGELVIKPTRD